MRRILNSPYLLLFCLALLPVIASGSPEGELQEGGLRASLTPDSAGVGGIATLILKYHLPEGARLSPGLEIKGLEGLIIVKPQTGPSVRQEGSGDEDRQGELRIRLLVNRLGSFKTGPLSLAYLDKEGKEKLLHARPAILKVVSNLGERPEEARIKPICDIIPTKARWSRYMPWAAAALALGLIAIALYSWYRRRLRSDVSTLHQDPAHVIAMREIEVLKTKRLFEKGHVKDFYFRFSEILRRYLEALRGFPAAEYTTEEIAASIKDPQDREILPLLRQADMVKFADLTPAPARKEDELNMAISYIRKSGNTLDNDLAAKGLEKNGPLLGLHREERPQGVPQ